MNAGTHEASTLSCAHSRLSPGTVLSLVEVFGSPMSNEGSGQSGISSVTATTISRHLSLRTGNS